MAAPLRNQLFAALALARQRRATPAGGAGRHAVPAAAPPVLDPPLRQAGAAGPVAQPGQFLWGGQSYSDPAAAVDWMNARGADTSLEQFLGNHPAIAALFPRLASAAPAPDRPATPAQPAVAALLAHALLQARSRRRVAKRTVTY